MHPNQIIRIKETRHVFTSQSDQVTQLQTNNRNQSLQYQITTKFDPNQILPDFTFKIVQKSELYQISEQI